LLLGKNPIDPDRLSSKSLDMEDLPGATPIMIVDDSREDIILLEHLLRRCKVLNPVVGCTSGEQCLSLLEHTIMTGRKYPVLMLVDIVMSPTSGIDVLRSMNSHGCIRQIPVIMHSGVRDLQVLREGYQLGAQTFLMKPVMESDIMGALYWTKRLRIESVGDGFVLGSTGEHVPSRDHGSKSFALKSYSLAS
jgi:two-component system, response regulator